MTDDRQAIPPAALGDGLNTANEHRYRYAPEISAACHMTYVGCVWMVSSNSKDGGIRWDEVATWLDIRRGVASRRIQE